MLIHLTLSDFHKTVVSIPVNSLSHWQKAETYPTFSGENAQTIPNSVVYLNNGKRLYVCEYVNQIDMLYKNQTKNATEMLLK